MTPDALRWVDVVLVLCVSCTASLVFAVDFDQRSRFAVLLGYGVVTVGGQIGAMGRPATWTTWLLSVVSLAAVAVTVRYVVKALPRVRGDGEA